MKGKIPWLVDWCSLPSSPFGVTSNWHRYNSLIFFSAFPNLSWCTMYTSHVVDTWPLTTESLSQLPKTGPWGSTSSEALLPSSWAEIGKCSWLGIPVLLRAQQDCLQFGGGEIWGLQFFGMRDARTFFGMESTKGWQFMKGTEGWHGWSLKENQLLTSRIQVSFGQWSG